MSTLLRLIELKNFVENNPTFSSVKWHKKLTITSSEISVLKQNKMVINQGSDRKPQWVWNAPIPNSVMAAELDKRRKQYIKRYIINQNRKKKVAPKQVSVKPSLKRSFLSVLENVDIRINDHITARVDVKKAVISRGSFSMEVSDPEMFSNILKLVK